jgi:hypothetical protein
MCVDVSQFVSHLREQLRHGEGKFMDSAWTSIDRLTPTATGLGFAYEVFPPSLTDASGRDLHVELRLPSNETVDSTAFAERVARAMYGTETVDDFIAAIASARIEIVKSRLYCIAMHLKWAAVEAEPEYLQQVDDWLSSIGGERITYADDVFYLPLREPVGTTPQGRAQWLRTWLRVRYLMGSPVLVTPKVDDGSGVVEGPSQEADQALILAAAAFTWHDYAMAYERQLNDLPQLHAAASMALIYAQESEHEDRSNWEQALRGREGGLLRHKDTTALKQWALEGAEGERGSDIEIARLLAGRLPTRFVGVSKNPERLIYEAIRQRRASKAGKAGRRV